MRLKKMKMEIDSKINIDQVVAYLNSTFNKASAKLATRLASAGKNARNTAGTPLYNFQVDFAYLIDNIQRSPSYIVPKYIQDANDLVISMDNFDISRAS